MQRDEAGDSEKSICGTLVEALRLIRDARHPKCAKISLCEGEPFGSSKATFLDEVLEMHRGVTTYVLRLTTGRTVCYSAYHTDVAGRKLERLCDSTHCDARSPKGQASGSRHHPDFRLVLAENRCERGHRRRTGYFSDAAREVAADSRLRLEARPVAPARQAEKLEEGPTIRPAGAITVA